MKTAGRFPIALGFHSPFLSTSVLFEHRSLFPLHFFDGVLKRFGSLQGMDMEASPRMFCGFSSSSYFFWGGVFRFLKNTARPYCVCFLSFFFKQKTKNGTGHGLGRSPPRMLSTKPPKK